MKNNYSSKSLQVLEGLEAVRKRPGMYIGSTDIYGLHHLIWEILDNSIDEALAGFTSKINITLNKNGSVTIKDNGRGIPVDRHKSGISGIELVFSKLHAGAKFGSDSGYKTAGGLHGVGASVVNALSIFVNIFVWRDGFKWSLNFLNGGTKVSKLTKIKKSKKTGTEITFKPDPLIFPSTQFNFDMIINKSRESAFLIPNLEVKAQDHINDKIEIFKFKNGLVDFMKFISSSKPVGSLIQLSNTFLDIKSNVVLQYNKSDKENIISFVNNVKTHDGGSHENGFKTGLTKAIKNYIKNQNIKEKFPIEGQDIREGLSAIISIYINEDKLEFEGQSKHKLSTIDARSAVENTISQNLNYWLIENKTQADKIISKIQLNAKARYLSRQSRKEIKEIKNNQKIKRILSGKLSPAQSKNYIKNELFLVEGDSAGGSAKLGRDRKHQAILPLRGKIINTEKANILDILKNEEINTIINAVGAGLQASFNVKKAKYGKVIIMTDADTDGAHIQSLLMAFFYHYMKDLIIDGRLYVAIPPLFKLTNRYNKKKIHYLYDEVEYQQFKNLEKYEIQRYKGLGEMNAHQLWETTMDPDTRTLIQITLNDEVFSQHEISTLMGSKVEDRKRWIQKNIKFTLVENILINQK